MLRVALKPLTTYRGFHFTRVTPAFKQVIEEDIRYLIDSLPPASKLYQNADGTPREPTDLELHKLAHLSVLNEKRKLTLWDYLRLSKTNSKLYADNYTDIQNLLPNSENGASGNIIDKIPYEDEKGFVKWRIVRENEKEGWEDLTRWLLIPGYLLFMAVYLFKDDKGVDQWADDELRLRALEETEGEEGAKELLRNDNKTPEEIKKRDELIVERILSGEYDKLSGLKIKEPKLPMLSDITPSTN
ncbi:hypothetical protein BN7_3070 [Wickerhamomyces ciferrii]|uniref:NADH dehydrogenase [ubiquinone] 1 beta subcomplex subunit 11, mitochondrial n=1 Tax=Wickerhamomyces ciferrii (strain ATCC 14091 / BCRC 22168 / CBS 111 / JCM 3599 / NBRC 0793 / NRRL Y-1031 F-60-10) TaxID=1206466 RepID=K0KQ03_WICCF|nr:uncharacterized protein BN7_3070 [Wickerhamomyces ciferrii]CCH43519.1 hypothetical protein BN7_3070 [Wickerhamomyces ciferrii]